MGARLTHCFVRDPPFVKIQTNEKKQVIRRNQFKSFKKMDDLIRALEILPPGISYKLISPQYGDISLYGDVKIYRDFSISYVEKRKLYFIDIQCTPLYT